MTTHDIIVYTDGEDPMLATGMVVDGHELVVPGGTSVKVEIGDSDGCTVTFTIFAKSVVFTQR